MPESAIAGHRALKAVIFDMDNTLFEFVDAQVMACKAVVERLGAGNKMDLFDYFLRHDFRFEDHQNIAAYMESLGIDDKEKFYECCTAYESGKLESLRPYAGMRRCLNTMRRRGLKLAIVTDATKENADARLKRTGLGRYFDHVVALEETWKRKPRPAPIRLALERLGVKPEEALLVGDSLVRDVGAGKAIGVATAYAAYGDKNYREDGRAAAEADYVLNRAQDICELVKNF